jgi:acyl-CoA reductase-like NAD-dependent aldehyde dehydrogenase
MLESGPVVSALENHCPVDLRALAPEPVTRDVAGKVLEARTAQRGWEALGFDARAAMLEAAAKLILERREQVLQLLHDETGKTPGDVLMGEALGALQFLRDYVDVARPYLMPRKLPFSPIAFPGKSGQVELIARGVVAIITPWNFPLATFFRPVFAALLCGNTVVLKPSELSPRMGAWFGRVLAETLPPRVLVVVQGGPEVGMELVRSQVDAVTFTGSTASGLQVARACAERLIPVSLELGGKDAAIVLRDCRFDRTIAGVMYWALTNAGQSCGAIERVFVEDPIADRFVEGLKTAVSRLRVTGDPKTSDIGPLSNARQLEIVDAHVTDAIARGAVLVCGGRRTGQGYWYEPTVLDRCTTDMLVMREPTFGPVIPVCRVPNAEAAVHATNASSYGLTASVWSQNIERAEAFARRLAVGTAYVNNHSFTGAMPAAPWTGVKSSGTGVASGVFALNHYTRPRTVVVDRNEGADAWWFPMDAALEELGTRLSDGLLGNALAALKVPVLLFRRQRAVLDFVRTGAPRTSRVTRALSMLQRKPERHD